MSLFVNEGEVFKVAYLLFNVFEEALLHGLIGVILSVAGLWVIYRNLDIFLWVNTAALYLGQKCLPKKCLLAITSPPLAKLTRIPMCPLLEKDLGAIFPPCPWEGVNLSTVKNEGGLSFVLLRGPSSSTANQYYTFWWHELISESIDDFFRRRNPFLNKHVLPSCKRSHSNPFRELQL